MTSLLIVYLHPSNLTTQVLRRTASLEFCAADGDVIMDVAAGLPSTSTTRLIPPSDVTSLSLFAVAIPLSIALPIFATILRPTMFDDDDLVTMTTDVTSLIDRFSPTVG